ncbi:MAG: hypothetical protein IT290_09475 [Deltaproteobacteria bacterium]|nr:hypothetical protein [Deltaproteobacteria bacterium]
MRHIFRIFVLVCATFSMTACTGGVMPKFSLRTIEDTERRANDTCEGKDRCVILYVAPWCPICHRNVAFFRELRRQLDGAPRVGVNYIVGNDRLMACEEFATEIGGKVFLDSRDEFEKISSFSSVPHFWVIDRERKILEDFSWTGSHDSDVNGAVRSFIEKDLELGEFVPERRVTYKEQNL